VRAGFLATDYGDEHGAPLVVTLCDPAAFAAPRAAVELPATAAAWATWCGTELSLSPAILRDPYTQQLFRRWCATNVTTAEMTSAAQDAIKTENHLSPSGLHFALAAQRQARLTAARQ